MRGVEGRASRARGGGRPRVLRAFLGAKTEFSRLRDPARGGARQSWGSGPGLCRAHGRENRPEEKPEAGYVGVGVLWVVVLVDPWRRVSEDVSVGSEEDRPWRIL